MAWQRLITHGFENRSVEEQTQLSGNAGTYSNTIKRTGDYSLQMGSATRIAFPLLLDVNRLRLNLAFQHSGTGTVGSLMPSIITILGTSGYLIAVGYDEPSQTLGLAINQDTVQTISAITSGFSSRNIFHDVGIQARIVNNSEGFVTVYINGVQQMHYSGAISGGNATGVFFPNDGSGFSGGGRVWSGSRYIDDLYVDAASGSEPNDVPPVRRFEYRPVSLNGAVSDWTPVGAGDNYAALTDNPPNGDTSYVFTDTDDDVDRYRFGGYTAPDGYLVTGLIPMIIARKTVATAGLGFRMVVDDGSMDAESAEVALMSIYRYHTRRFAQRPSGGNWGASLTTDTEIGFKAVIP